jgi:anti-anti-sigma factor
MEYKIQDMKNELKLNIVGELDIDQSETLRNILTEAINQPKPVVIDLENVSEISLTTLQLLCAAHRSATMKNKNISLKSITDVVRDIVHRAGYQRNQG